MATWVRMSLTIQIIIGKLWASGMRQAVATPFFTGTPIRCCHTVISSSEMRRISRPLAKEIDKRLSTAAEYAEHMALTPPSRSIFQYGRRRRTSDLGCTAGLITVQAPRQKCSILYFCMMKSSQLKVKITGPICVGWDLIWIESSCLP